MQAQPAPVDLQEALEKCGVGIALHKLRCKGAQVCHDVLDERGEVLSEFLGPWVDDSD